MSADRKDRDGWRDFSHEDRKHKRADEDEFDGEGPDELDDEFDDEDEDEYEDDDYGYDDDEDDEDDDEEGDEDDDWGRGGPRRRRTGRDGRGRRGNDDDF